MSGPARFVLADQLILPIGHSPATSRADFIVTPCNQAAVNLIHTWPDWRFGRMAAIVGPPASGKSHLAAIFAARSGAEIVDARALGGTTIDAFARRTVVIEDIPLVADERALLHCLNAAIEAGGHVLMTAREAPGAWRLALPDLASRLRQVFVAEIGSPDDDLVGALFIKLFADRQLAVGPEVIAFLLPRIERSQAAVCRLVERLDEAALRAGRPITLPLARAVLEDEAPHINDP